MGIDQALRIGFASGSKASNCYISMWDELRTDYYQKGWKSEPGLVV
jgi:hypothetical protein